MATGLAKSLCDAYTVMGAEIDRLRARLEVRDDGGPDGISCRDESIRLQDTEIARLRAENERLKADAARYAWLRRQHWSDASMCVVMKPRSAVRLGHECPSVDRLDAAIDAAMAQGDKA
mgnify:CR=1 FL=1